MRKGTCGYWVVYSIEKDITLHRIFSLLKENNIFRLIDEKKKAKIEIRIWEDLTEEEAENQAIVRPLVTEDAEKALFEYLAEKLYPEKKNTPSALVKTNLRLHGLKFEDYYMDEDPFE